MKALKFKYNKREIFALKSLMEQTVLIDESTEIKERLLLALLMGVYKKIHTKTFEIKDKYSITFSAPEALAFTIYFNKYVTALPYESRLIRLITAETDKKLL